MKNNLISGLIVILAAPAILASVSPILPMINAKLPAEINTLGAELYQGVKVELDQDTVLKTSKSNTVFLVPKIEIVEQRLSLSLAANCEVVKIELAIEAKVATELAQQLQEMYAKIENLDKNQPQDEYIMQVQAIEKEYETKIAFLKKSQEISQKNIIQFTKEYGGEGFAIVSNQGSEQIKKLQAANPKLNFRIVEPNNSRFGLTPGMPGSDVLPRSPLLAEPTITNLGSGQSVINISYNRFGACLDTNLQSAALAYQYTVFDTDKDLLKLEDRSHYSTSDLNWTSK